MKLRIAVLLAMICLAVLSGCEADRMSEKGFSLPPGDAAQGRDASFTCIALNATRSRMSDSRS
jgi:hypothetical protein